MDGTLGPLVNRLSERENNKYIGNMHYDWSYFDLFEKDSIEPIILLREPISRFVESFIYFSLYYVKVGIELSFQEDDSGCQE
jgi:hypothetical protein